MSEESRTAKLQLSWLRRQWLKVAAVIGDNPRMATFVLVGSIGLMLFYGIRLGGCAHFIESAARWRLETFGGVHHVSRAVRTSDVVLSLKLPQYDRLDLTSPTAVHLGGSAFRKELGEIAENGGHLRINILDPRISDLSHPQHERFLALAAVFGQTHRELDARLWHSVSVLLRLQDELGDRLEARLISAPSADAKAPYFTIGRSGHLYQSANPKHCLDVIVPRPETPSFTDSSSDPSVIIVNRPNNPEVLRFSEAFKSLWEAATPLDAALQQELRARIDG